MTDLSVDRNEEVAHAPLDPAGPGSIKGLHHRLMKVHRHVSEPSVQTIRASLMGEAERVKDNGLGFDAARLGSLADKTDKWVDPVVEVLAFFGLAVLPMRGRGSDGSSERTNFRDERQRGWRKLIGGGRRRFVWPAWDHPLDVDGIDALLDVWNPEKKSQWPLYGVHAGWRTVSFEPRGGGQNPGVRFGAAVSPEPVVPISGIEHFAYCPRQCALIHCDGIWSDNEYTVRGTRAHRRVDSGAHRRERGNTVLRSIPLWSEALGLSGRADAVEVDDDGSVRPIEYKSGVRHGIAADLQLCAQALCLEEMLGVEIPDGFVWYGGPRRRESVQFSEALRNQVLAIVQEIRSRLLSGRLPEPVNDGRCNECQLLHHCLPGLSGTPRKVNRYIAEVVYGCGT